MNRPGVNRPADLPASVRRAGCEQAGRGREHPPDAGPGKRARGGRGPAVAVLVLAIEFYRRLASPLLPPSCRYHPSCSAYAQEALRKHGLLRGMRLAAGRILRCHPFHAGGWDPVP